jgi:hypothetical protein
VENKGVMFFDFPKCSKTGQLTTLMPVCVENAVVSTDLERRIPGDQWAARAIAMFKAVQTFPARG